jgi:hypothetical protein
MEKRSAVLAVYAENLVLLRGEIDCRVATAK